MTTITENLLRQTCGKPVAKSHSFGARFRPTSSRPFSGVGISGVSTRARARAGRPTLLTPELQDAICGNLLLALPDKYAAEANGIASSTFYEWLEKGAAGEEPYAVFAHAVMVARGQAVVGLTVVALAGGPGSAQACWLLERRYRKEYGLHQKIELGGDPDGVPLKSDAITAAVEQLTVDELRKLIALCDKPDEELPALGRLASKNLAGVRQRPEA